MFESKVKPGTFGDFRITKKSERPIEGYGSYCPVHNNVASESSIEVKDSEGNIVGEYSRTAYYREEANNGQTTAHIFMAGKRFRLLPMFTEEQEARRGWGMDSPLFNTEPSEGYKLVAEDGTEMNAPDISRRENRRMAFKRNIEAIYGVKVGR